VQAVILLNIHTRSKNVSVFP